MQSETPNTEEVEAENSSGNYYHVVGVWYEDVAPDSDSSGYFYYETADSNRYRIRDSEPVSVGCDNPEQEAVFGCKTKETDGTYMDDIDGDIDP